MSSDARLRRLIARRREGRLADCLTIKRVYRHTTKKELPYICMGVSHKIWAPIIGYIVFSSIIEWTHTNILFRSSRPRVMAVFRFFAYHSKTGKVLRTRQDNPIYIYHLTLKDA
jgi:hypothetical protein